MQDYQIFTAIIASCFFLVVFVLIRRDAILMGAAFRWFAIAIVILILGFYPQIANIMAKKVGIAYSPILPIIIACLVLMVKVLIADIERAKTQIKLDRVAQRLAMLEAKVQKQKQ